MFEQTNREWSLFLRANFSFWYKGLVSTFQATWAPTISNADIIRKNADVIIFDLGLSSIQLNDLDRGFSFKSNKKMKN